MQQFLAKQGELPRDMASKAQNGSEEIQAAFGAMDAARQKFFQSQREVATVVKGGIPVINGPDIVDGNLDNMRACLHQFEKSVGHLKTVLINQPKEEEKTYPLIWVVVIAIIAFAFGFGTAQNYYGEQIVQLQASLANIDTCPERARLIEMSAQLS